MWSTGSLEHETAAAEAANPTEFFVETMQIIYLSDLDQQRNEKRVEYLERFWLGFDLWRTSADFVSVQSDFCELFV